MTVNLSTGQKEVYYDNCNTLAKWTNTGKIYPANTSGYNWLAVVPRVPSADHTGNGGGCFYVNGGYGYAEAHNPNYILYQLVSAPINLKDYDNCRLEFYMQMRSEVDGWDGGFVEWSKNGTDWVQINNGQLCLQYDGNMSQNTSSTPFYPRRKPAWYNYRTTWTRVVADISDFDNVSSFRLRFTFHSDEAEDNIGWAIDDIKIINTAEIKIKSKGRIIKNADNSPAVDDNTDFGDVVIGSTTVHSFSIYNLGDEPLTLTGSPYVTVTGTDFSVIKQPKNSVLAPGDSTTFDIQFKPGESGVMPGIINGTVSIPNSDEYSACKSPNPYTFSVKVNGIYK